MPPKWIVEPEDQSVILGNSVIIPCEADGSPIPTILWKQAIGKCFVEKLLRFRSFFHFCEKAGIKMRFFSLLLTRRAIG